MPDNKFPGDPDWINNLRKIHPFKLAIYVAIIAIGIMFVFLTLGFVLTKSSELFKLPSFFTVSTGIILISGVFISNITKKLKEDVIQKLYINLIYILILGVLFCATQYLGFRALYQNGIIWGKNISYTYLYLLSGLHLVHFLAGMIYAIYLLVKIKIAKSSAVKELIYTTDPYELMLLELLKIYWHFMGFLWLIMYFVFVLHV